MSPLRRLGFRGALVLLLALFLFVVFCSLGTWQVQRLGWKLALIERVERQLAKAPVHVPGRAQWRMISTEHNYLPVKLAGTFLHDRESFVQAMTAHGSGYWLMTPLRTNQGFVVLVNRGFVDQPHKDASTRQAAQLTTAVEVSGLLRVSEPDGRFLQANEPDRGRWFSRDVAAIGRQRGFSGEDLAPYFVDADARPNPGGWPVGGLTVVQFRNAHLGYALTWYTLALMTVIGAVLMLRYVYGQRERG